LIRPTQRRRKSVGVRPPFLVVAAEALAFQIAARRGQIGEVRRVMPWVGHAQLVQHDGGFLVRHPCQPCLAGGAGQQRQRRADVGPRLQRLIGAGRFHVHHLQAVSHNQ